MENYKTLAAKLESFDYRMYIMARIYNEIKDLKGVTEEQLDTFVHEGYTWYMHSERISPEEIGLAIWNGWRIAEKDEIKDFETIILLGLENPMY